MANLAQCVNVLQAVILTDKAKMILTPTYHVMHMYNVHQDATLIPLEFQSPLYTFEGKTLPAVSVSASKDRTETVHISMVNIDAHKENTIELDLNALGLKNVTASILSSKNLQDYNSFDKPNNIQPTNYKDFKLKKGVLQITVPPFSVIVLEAK